MNEFSTDDWYRAFSWWYFDHYLDCIDPFGYFGKKSDRAILTHVKLKGSSLNKEIRLFFSNLDEWQKKYDCLCHMYEGM